MDETRRLLIATRNRGKLEELSVMLSDLPLRLVGLAEFPRVGEAEETGETFTENAVLKSQFYAGQTGLWTLADDSGLEVFALGNEPGVRSARYAGPGATDAEKVRLLLARLGMTGDAERRARFVCTVALARPEGGDVPTFEGICEGRIAAAPSGGGGFGYDPVFVPDGFDETFGELPAEVKNRLSHRARALAKVRQYLASELRRT